jgi:Transglutaminase-like superfamily
MRPAFTLAVVLSWLVMVGLLVRREVFPPALQEAPLPVREPAEHDEWFTVSRDGRQVGHAHRVTSFAGDGQRFSEDLVLAFAMLGVPQRIATGLEAETDGRGALRRFRFTLVSPATTFTAAGTTDGRTLRVTYGPQGQTKDAELPLAEPIQLPSTVRPRVVAGDAQPGARWTVPVLNPLTLRSDSLVTTVEARETVPGPDGPVEAIRIAEEQQGVRTHAWLAPDGTVLREDGALGFTLERTSRDRAIANDATLAPVDLVAASRIPLDGRIDDPRTASRLALRVSGAAAGTIPDDPPRQRVDHGLLRIERETVPESAPLGTGDAALASYLAPAPFIESDDPAIVATAREVVGTRRNATAAARALVDWVNATVRKEPTVTMPSAREVLAARRGDCNEHAVLLTALARAAGIPARLAAGVMYLDGGFYYHAWTEVWLGRWVSADAVFRQLPADATHVKLVEGGPEQQAALAATVGGLAFAAEEVGR